MKIKLMMPLKKADEELGDLAQFDSDGFVFVAELVGCQLSDFNMDEEREADVSFFCHHINGIYKTEEEFHAAHPGMAVESFIPVGAFPSGDADKNWRPSPMNLINSIVDEVVDNETYHIPEEATGFYGRLCGARIDQSICYASVEEKDHIEAGNIFSGIFWAEVRLLEGK